MSIISHIGTSIARDFVWHDFDFYFFVKELYEEVILIFVWILTSKKGIDSDSTFRWSYIEIASFKNSFNYKNYIHKISQADSKVVIEFQNFWILIGHVKHAWNFK